jgi:type IV pilus assembly protein PilM
LETIDEFSRIDVSALNAECFNNPGEFCVAAGLALQALGQSRLRINLIPPEKSGLLSLLKSRKKPKAAWGIDLGRAAIRAIRLKYQPDTEQIVAEAVELVEHASLIGAPVSNADSLFAESLEKLLSRIDLGDSAVCVGIPAQKALFRAVELPLTDEAKLAELMKFEVPQQIPFPLESVVWDYQLLGSSPTAIASVRECHVVLLALKLDDANAALAPFRQRGLKVDTLTTDAAALFNSVMFEQEQNQARSHAPRGGALESQRIAQQALGSTGGLEHASSHSSPGNAGVFPAPSSTGAVTLILDVGVEASNILLTDGQALQIRSFPLGGNLLTRALVKEFRLTFDDAEKLKRSPATATLLHRVYAALDPRFAELDHELSRTIDRFLTIDPSRRLTRFIVAGGALRMHSALRRLWHGP